jgi:hypothetical protein
MALHFRLLMHTVDVEPPNEALHRTAICAWRFALEFLAFISQIVAVGELSRSAEAVRWGQPGMFFALFILSDPLRSRRLCVLFFNAEAAETTEFRREFEFGAL